MDAKTANANVAKYPQIDMDIVSNFREFSNLSETCAKFMIEKVISLVITESERRDIDKAIPDHCFEFLKNSVNTCMKFQFIAYDRDDNDMKLEDSEILGKKVIHQRSSTFERNSLFNFNENTFSESHEIADICPPIKSMLNRQDTYTYPPSTNLFYNITYRGVNDWTEIHEPSRVIIDRAASTAMKTLRIIPYSTIKEEHREINADTKLKRDSGQDAKYKEKKTLYDSPLYTGKKQKLPPIELPSSEIPSDKFPKINEDPENEKLRKEKEEESKKKEEEHLVLMKKEREKQEKAVEVTKKQREFERKNITLDAKGNVVQIRPVWIENLGREFIVPSSTYKDIREIINPIVVQSKNEKVEGNLQGKKDEKVVNTTEKEKDKEIPVKNMKKVTVIPVSSAKTAVVDRKKETSPSAEPVSKEHKHDRGPIIPAGSSFDLIHPEVGVSIHEENKYKSGGKDYYKQYQKYSIENYNKQFKEAANANANANFTNTFKDTKYSFSNDNSTYNQPELLEDSLLQNTMTKELFGTGYSKSQTESMKMNTKLSLRAAMEELDLIREVEEHLFPDGIETNQKVISSSVDVFKNRKKISKDDPLKGLEEMNRFNSTILQNASWGYPGFKKHLESFKGIKVPAKPQMKEIEKEMGKSIVKTKLPRSRFYSYVKNPQSMMAATISGFNFMSKKSPLMTTSVGFQEKTNQFSKTTETVKK